MILYLKSSKILAKPLKLNQIPILMKTNCDKKLCTLIKDLAVRSLPINKVDSEADLLNDSSIIDHLQRIRGKTGEAEH
jgi:hypothetical protein